MVRKVDDGDGEGDGVGAGDGAGVLATGGAGVELTPPPPPPQPLRPIAASKVRAVAPQCLRLPMSARPLPLAVPR